MTVTYCAVTDVATQLGLRDPDTTARLTLSASTIPTSTEVSDFINQAEDEIDRITNHAWRTVTVTNEYRNNDGPTYVKYLYCVYVKLAHRNIKTLSTDTDKVEYFDGTTWIDLLATKTQGDGFGEGDYWLDLQNGILYIHGSFPTYGPASIRVTYRYGESTVPNDIKQACIYLAAVRVLESDMYARMLPVGGDKLDMRSLLSRLEKRAMDILTRYIEVSTT